MSQYAIINTGSKQYRVEPNHVVEIERFDFPEDQKQVTLDQVLLVRDGEKIHVGNPWVKGASVLCDNLGEFRGPKVVSLKYRRRKASRKKHGHRQDLLRLLVKEIKF